jgi:hypothetical protein
MQCGTRLEARGSLPSSVRIKATEPKLEPARPVKGAPVSDTGYSLTTQRANRR